jgi:hypothetical protein
MKIFRAHNRREDFSHSHFTAMRKPVMTLIKNYCSIYASRHKRCSVIFYQKKRLHSFGKEDKGVKTDTMTFDLAGRPQTMKP